MWKILSERIDSRSTIEPAVSELCHASGAGVTLASRSSSDSSIFSMASLRRWL
jgi:hypothetical protein